MKYSVVRALAGSAAIALFLVPAQAKPPKHSAPAASPQAAIGGVWNKLLTHCGDSYFYAGSVFDRQGMLSSIGAGKNPVALEFKGVKFNTVPFRITEAERMNGIEYRVRITMMARIYRTSGDSWTDGPGLRARNTNDILALALQSVVGDAGEMGTGGAMAFDLVKFKGLWAIGRSSQNMSGPLTMGTQYVAVQDLIDARVDRYDCRQAKVLPPPPTPSEIAAQREADRAAKQKADDDARQQAEEQRKREEDERREQVDREEMARRMAPWKFSGTPQEFKAALLERLQKRAVEFGVDASSYRNEIDEIMNIVATCTALTQTDFSRAYAIRNPRLRLEALNDCDGSAKDVSVWGTRLSPKGTRGIGVSRSVSTYDPKRQDFVMANKFNIVVKFLPVQPEDRTARPMHLIEDIGPTYDIISASIPFSNAGSP